MNPDNTHFQSSQVFPQPLWPPTIPQKGRKRKKNQVQLVLPIYSLEHDQTPSDQP